MSKVYRELIANIQSEFEYQLKYDVTCQRFYEKVASKTATLVECQRYSQHVGKALQRSIEKYLGAEYISDVDIFDDLAASVIDPVLRNGYDAINSSAEEILQYVNKKNRIGISTTRAPVNEDRIRGICKHVSEGKTIEDQVKRTDGLVENFCESVYDEFIEANAKRQQDAGLNVTITRTVKGKGCDWCKNLAGSWTDYHDVQRAGAFQRHQRCHCEIDYKGTKMRTSGNAFVR